MAKTLILINGCMGVGKTAVAQALYRRLQRSVWLDGDWCWMMNPWVISDENKRMVEDNIAYLLRSFLTNEGFDYVVFSWVMHRPEIIEGLLERLADLPFEAHRISLVCSEEVLRARMLEGGRDGLAVEESLRRAPLYRRMDTHQVDTTDLPIAGVVDAILRLIGAGEGRRGVAAS